MIDFWGILKDTKERFCEIFLASKKTTLVVSLVLLAMTCAAIILVVTAIEKSKPQPVEIEKEFSSDTPLLVPPSPVATDDYIFSRNQEGKWQDDEAEKWFTSPTQNALDELSVANDRIVSDITGAAP